MKSLLIITLLLALPAVARADDATAPGAATCPTSTAPFPGATGNAHPEEVNVVTGDTADYSYADGSGYVHVPITQALKVLKDAKIVIDRRRVDEWSFPPFKDKSGFVVHNVVRGPAIVEFDMTWHHAPTDGSEAAPKQMCVAGLKTAGSQYIESIQQSVLVQAVDAHTTAVQIVCRIKAESAGKDDAAQYVRDVFASLLAKAHGKPLPEYKKE